MGLTNQPANSIAITWIESEELIKISFNRTKTIEDSEFTYLNFEIVNSDLILFIESQTKKPFSGKIWKYKDEEHNHDSTPYKGNQIYLFRTFLSDIISQSRLNNNKSEYLLSLFFDKENKELPYRIFGDRNSQLGRFIINNLRDSSFKTVKRNTEFLQSLNQEQKDSFENLITEIIDDRILTFLCSVDESFWDEYDGIKLMIGNSEFESGETEEGGLMQEFFNWRRKYSKFKNFDY
ncbi:MAG: hypothetical protein IPL46_18785 [Saprospiraceae bacterium]|nr:hypothetical protein [Saprospiraceae bacterium]